MASDYWTAVIAGVAITLTVQAAIVAFCGVFYFRSQAKAEKAKAKAEIALHPPSATRTDILAKRIDSLEARLNSRLDRHIGRHIA